MIQVFERAKTYYALDSTATVIGGVFIMILHSIICQSFKSSLNCSAYSDNSSKFHRYWYKSGHE
jgi:hypothetical protein